MRKHLPEYMIEAAGIGVFMIVASACATLLEYPGSPIRAAIPDPVMRRMLMGLAMGTTVVAIVYSAWGARSGAHLNPALTLTFWRLGKIAPGDAFGYALAQVIGAGLGITLAVGALGRPLAAPEVNYIATLPGRPGPTWALVGEIAIAFVQMSAVLWASNSARFARFTGLLAGALVAVYITVEAPLSGMSLNPARSLGPAAFAHALGTFWIYVAGPLAGMLLAAEFFTRVRGARAVLCAKLYHGRSVPCPFNCRFHEIAP